MQKLKPRLFLTVTRNNGDTLSASMRLHMMPEMVSIGSRLLIDGAIVNPIAMRRAFRCTLTKGEAQWIAEVIQYAINEGPVYAESKRDIGAFSARAPGSDADDSDVPLYIEWRTIDLEEKLNTLRL